MSDPRDPRDEPRETLDTRDPQETRTGRELEPRRNAQPDRVRREQGASSVERFTAGESAHTVGLTEERAAGVVRQSGNARTMAFVATLILVLFVPLYWFYDIGFPLVAGSSRLEQEKDAQIVTSVSHGYKLYLANCAQCHGENGQGGGPAGYGPPLNDQGKLYNAFTPTGLPGTGHLNPNYIRNVLEVGGRYVCGNPQSQMPVWSNTNGGPLNYKEIEDLVAFITASKETSWDYVEDSHGEGSQEQSQEGEGSEATEVPHGPKVLNGWRDPEYEPGAEATPVPECWSRPEGEQAGGNGASPSAPAIENPGTADNPRIIRLTETGDLKIKDENGTVVDKIGVKRGETVTFEVTNEAGYPHNFYVGDPQSLEANAKPKLKGIPEWNSGTQSFTWTVEGEGRLQFACTVPGHYPPMHGDFILVD